MKHGFGITIERMFFKYARQSIDLVGEMEFAFCINQNKTIDAERDLP
jgi:hypothetical protein